MIERNISQHQVWGETRKIELSRRSGKALWFRRVCCLWPTAIRRRNAGVERKAPVFFPRTFRLRLELHQFSSFLNSRCRTRPQSFVNCPTAENWFRYASVGHKCGRRQHFNLQSQFVFLAHSAFNEYLGKGNACTEQWKAQIASSVAVVFSERQLWKSV